MTVVSGAECVKALRRVGYTELRQRGSHVRMHCPGRGPVTVRSTARCRVEHCGPSCGSLASRRGSLLVRRGQREEARAHTRAGQARKA